MTDRQTPQNPEQNPGTDPQAPAPSGEPRPPQSEVPTNPTPQQPAPPAPPQQPAPHTGSIPPQGAPAWEHPDPGAPVPPPAWPAQAAPGVPPQGPGYAPQGPGYAPQDPGEPPQDPHPAPPVVTTPDFPPHRDPVPAPDVLDEGTYTEIREPRAPGLALDGAWHQISPKYVVSQLVQELFWLLVVAAAALVLAFGFDQHWAWIPGGIIVFFQLVSLIILPRQAKALGYMLRGDDVVFRKGILWQRMVAVPYGRMQLIDISHGPMDRMFGVAKLKMVTAAAATGVEIPGLSQQAAEALRDTLVDVAETRRTGL